MAKIAGSIPAEPTNSFDSMIKIKSIQGEIDPERALSLVLYPVYRDALDWARGG